MMRGLVLVLAMAACAQGAEIDPQLVGPFVPRAGELEPASCGMAFDPAPELLEATEAAAVRWSAATGCDVRVEAGGVPVVLVRGLVTASGKRAAGAWRHTAESDVCLRVDIDDEFGGPRAVAHELGHCLMHRVNLAPQNLAGSHAESGLMAEGAPGDIDGASLSLVCSSFDCAAFTPEL